MKEKQAELDHLHVWRWAKVMMDGPLARVTGNTSAHHAPLMFVFK